MELGLNDIANAIYAILEPKITQTIESIVRAEKMRQIEEKRYLTAKQAAQLHHVTEKTIRKWVKAGILTGEKKGGTYQIVANV